MMKNINVLMVKIMVITLIILGLTIPIIIIDKCYDDPYVTDLNNYEILYEGEVIEITYWNVTVEHINLRYLNYSIGNYTYELCNFTIINGTSNKEIKLTTYADYFIDKVEIGDTVIIYHSYGMIWDFKVIKKEVN